MNGLSLPAEKCLYTEHYALVTTVHVCLLKSEINICPAGLILSGVRP